MGEYLFICRILFWKYSCCQAQFFPGCFGHYYHLLPSSRICFYEAIFEQGKESWDERRYKVIKYQACVNFPITRHSSLHSSLITRPSSLVPRHFLYIPASQGAFSYNGSNNHKSSCQNSEGQRFRKRKKNPNAAAKMILEEETIEPALALTCLYPMVSNT